MDEFIVPRLDESTPCPCNGPLFVMPPAANSVPPIPIPAPITDADAHALPAPEIAKLLLIVSVFAEVVDKFVVAVAEPVAAIAVIVLLLIFVDTRIPAPPPTIALVVFIPPI